MFQQSGGLTSQNMDYGSLKAMILKGILGEPVWFIWYSYVVFFRHETLVVGSRHMA